ncbi:unnamed protein product [Mytilus coruscus]|uniref:Ubiquitin-like protease family profile domain-containing protein n=1 Tax=Mytilus coruscus TaxID=42192 RepID=A0A6J8C641_MYTCO|nr:unnamed protein product [Mytilus coruscus]
MTGKDVEEALSGLPVAVCCAEDLPSYVSDRPRTFVVNTDNCDQEGSHWVAFHFPASGPLEFFDSLGRLPETYQRYFRYVLIVNGPEHCVVGNQIQPDDSDTCGLYCIYYVKLRCRGLEMKDIINNFSSTDLIKNDSKLVAYLDKKKKERRKKEKKKNLKPPTCMCSRSQVLNQILYLEV